GIRRDDADVRLHVDETVFIEGLRIDDRRIDVGEDLEVGRATDIVAVARRAVGHDALPVDARHLSGFEGLDHAVPFRHPADPHIRFYAHQLPSPTIEPNLPR